MESEIKQKIGVKGNKGTDYTDDIADNLDNTASYKTIIGSIESKRRKEKTLTSYINNTVRRRNFGVSYLAFSDFFYPSHTRNAFTEDWHGQLESGFFEGFPFKSLMPWMITKVKNCGKPDPVTELLHQNYDWIKKWTSFKQSYWQTKKVFHKWFDDNVLYCPKMYIEMAEHIVNKPDPLFEDVYNWYYAGKGNMTVGHWDGSDYLICSDFNCLYVSPFFKDNLSIDNTNTATYSCTEGTNILETIQSQNAIVLRTRCKIIILKIVTTAEGLTLEKLKEMDSELPFTSISFDEYHKNIVHVMTIDCQLKIVNLDRMTACTKKLHGKVPSLVDNWGSVISAERACFAHITKKAITLYDKRTNKPFQRWKHFKYVTDKQVCAKLSAAKYVPQKPLMYVATNHEVFLMDMRCGRTKVNNITPVQRWTHGMISPPTYLDICNFGLNNNREMLCMSSQWFEDMCIVNTYSDRLTRTGEINGLSIPFRPPSIMQTFNEALRKRQCCSLEAPIHHRICSAISGLSIVDQGDNYSVLMQNSLGDVSCHALYPEHMVAFIEDDSTDKLHEWSQSYKDTTEPFEVSHIINIRPVLRNLIQVPKDYILGRNTIIKPIVKFNEDEIYETYEKEELDPELLEIWKENDDEIVLDKTGMSQFIE